MNKESLFHIGLGVIALAGAVEISQWAFSRHSKHRIEDRVIKEYGYLCSELSGIADEPLEAAHWNHDKRNPFYDSPDNGRLLTLSEHLLDHIERHGRNGLAKWKNKEAISALKQRVIDYYGEEYLFDLLAPKVEV